MASIMELWLPILVSAVLVFFASSIFHMVIPIHKSDWKKLPGEEKIMAEIRAHGVESGQYMFPMCASMKDMGSPEMVEKMKLGPVGHVTILPQGGANMGKCLILWFLYCVLIGVILAFAAGPVLGRGAAFKQVFHLIGLAALMAYALIPIPESIWKGQPWGITAKFLFDGAVYAILTGLTFAWLWPS
jgi:hypothetical protein